MEDKLSYRCPECGEPLTLDKRYANFLDGIDIICPACKKNYSGKALVREEAKEIKAIEEVKEAEHIDKVKEAEPNEKAKGRQEKKKGQDNQLTTIAALKVIKNFTDESGTPGEEGDIYRISQATTVVGRKSNSSTADIQIVSNRYMSRQHIVITENAGKYSLKWANPTNPPVVNGVAVARDGSVELKDGDIIILGQCEMEWKYRIIDENRSLEL